MKQGGLFDDDRPVVVFRYRQGEDRVEIRWSGLDLCAVFQDWKTALDNVVRYEAQAGVPFTEASVRVRQ